MKEFTICDFCNRSEVDGIDVYSCTICGNDICFQCMTSARLNTKETIELCPDCVTKCDITPLIVSAKKIESLYEQITSEYREYHKILDQMKKS